MILDTDFLIQLFGGKDAAHSKAKELHESDEIQRVPVAVIAELEYGAEFALDEDEQRRIQNLSRMYSIVRLDEQMARLAGQLFAQADRNADDKSGVDMVDAMVAALAETTDERVVTNNVTDFESLGVRVETF
jgi:predicted nucleic acid-binding protein